MNDDGTPAYNNQASIDAFNFFADLYKNKWLPPETINDGYAETQQLFFTDKAAMMLHGSWLKSRMDELAPNLKGKIGLAPNPKDPRTGNWGQNSGGWGIAVTTKDPAKQEAAAYLVSLIAGLDKGIYTEWMHEVGNIPTTKYAAADPSFRATEWDRTVMDNLKYSHTRPVQALYPDASLEWAQAFQETLLGADAQKALSDAVQRAIQIGKDKGLLQ
jgi:multiple sugar transport system substrate-binding protein